MKLSDESIIEAEEGSCQNGDGGKVEDCVVLMVKKNELDYEIILTFDDLKMMVESLGATVVE